MFEVNDFGDEGFFYGACLGADAVGVGLGVVGQEEVVVRKDGFEGLAGGDVGHAEGGDFRGGEHGAVGGAEGLGELGVEEDVELGLEGEAFDEVH